MKIYLVRHGQSEANHDRSIHKHKPDYAMDLTPLGQKQATLAGLFLKERIMNDLKHNGITLSFNHRVRIWQSPYYRARQTAAAIEKEMRSNFPLNSILEETKEHLLLGEQQMGMFDGYPESEWPEVFPEEYAHWKKHTDYRGHFWARMPLGESRFDVAVRTHQAFGTFHRDNDRHGIGTIIVVCHGVVVRTFTQMWLHKPWEWMENEPNPGNTWIRYIDHKQDKGYIYKPEFSDKPYNGKGK